MDKSPLVIYDRRKSRDGALLLAGVDEAGRGCWAGPVVAAAVILTDDGCPPGLNDSKQLSRRRREAVFQHIITSALSWGACAVSARRIDETDILRATLEAMSRSLARLRPRPELILVDGLQTPATSIPAESVVRGDATSAAIAAASVVAKVLRDRIMCAFARHFPDYGFADHKGYGTAAHRQALHRHGPCPLHRLSYKPLAELEQGRLF